jgi:hypothetical protein
MTNTYSYHYTTGEKVQSIITDGQLNRSIIGITEGELPVLWFSKNQRFENTSRKGLFYRGNKLNWDLSLQHNLMTNVRFGIRNDDPRLMNWITTCSVSGTPTRDVRYMEKIGKIWGSFPSNWYGVLSDVSIKELTFQVWDGNQWIDRDIHNWYNNEYSPKTDEEKESLILEHYKKLDPKGWMNNPIFKEDESKHDVIKLEVQHHKSGRVVRLRFPNRDVIVPTEVFNRTLRKGQLTDVDLMTLLASEIV